MPHVSQLPVALLMDSLDDSPRLTFVDQRFDVRGCSNADFASFGRCQPWTAFGAYVFSGRSLGSQDTVTKLDIVQETFTLLLAPVYDASTLHRLVSFLLCGTHAC